MGQALKSLELGVESLLKRRSVIDSQWNRFVSGASGGVKIPVREDIASSWQRSAQYTQPRHGGKVPFLAKRYNANKSKLSN